ncbi:hypothetical protein BJ741DRAFT_585145 [Chytriomyces cf. hyalinus JEL632]|nr:hypothetical protein BJ741DRAFT_585145 [Chytriomyces cf. hyalinus JEL632]
MAYHTQPNINLTALLDAQERLAKFELAEDLNPSATYIPPIPSQPSRATANPISGGINLVLRMKPQPQAPQTPQPPQAQDENIVQNINEHSSSSGLNQSHIGSNDDTLSDFGSDNDNDAVWDQALIDTESVQEKQPSTDKEKQVDYLAIMKNAESLANRGKMRWEEGWRKSQSMARVGNDPWEMGWKTVRPESPAKKKENAH